MGINANIPINEWLSPEQPLERNQREQLGPQMHAHIFECLASADVQR
jgi:hypothetical protein